MSLIRKILIGYIFIIYFLFNTGNSYLKSQSADTSRAYSIIVDTSDYFSNEYIEALDYNLMIAASKGYPSEIIRLISKGASINAETPEGVTPLIFAVSNNKLYAVKTLLEFSPSLDILTLNHETALLIAVKNDFFQISEALIRAGADMEFTDIHGATPLHHAALNGFLKITDMLLYYDTPVNVQADDGTTPLLAAIRMGNTEIADLLIQQKANTEITDNEGFTPFIMSAYFGDTVIMDILYKSGANIYAVTKAGHNALTIAVSNGDKTTTEYLLKKGDSWTSHIYKALDPYKIASTYGRVNLVGLLKKYEVPGTIKYAIKQISFSASTLFSFHDMYTGLDLAFKEPLINAGFEFGLDTKLWYSRLLIKESESSYYQYMDKESVVYAGLFKDFALTNRINKVNFIATTSLKAGYSFGNYLKGTHIAPENKVKINPSILLKMTKNSFSFFTGMEYMKTKFYHNGPLWFRAGISYNYYLDNVKIKFKPIKW